MTKSPDLVDIDTFSLPLVDADWMEFGYSRTVGDFDLSGAFVLSEKELASGSDGDEDGDFSRFIFSISTGF